APLERFNIGWLYGRAHDSPDALRLFHSVQADVPDRLTHAYAIALADFEQGEFQASIDTLAALRAQGIFDAKCADLLGVSYSKLDRYQDAYAVMADNMAGKISSPAQCHFSTGFSSSNMVYSTIHTFTFQIIILRTIYTGDSIFL
ncbi:MAG: hypothetical protein ABSF34_16020, partial [Verrucomicrobiota bacterium]